MKQEDSRYKLMHVINSKTACNDRAFVKKIGDELFIFDRQGNGEHWDLSSGAAEYVKGFNCPLSFHSHGTFTLGDAFIYQDQGKHEDDKHYRLLVAFNEREQQLYFYNLDTYREKAFNKYGFNCCYDSDCICISYKFRLMQKNDGSLILDNIGLTRKAGILPVQEIHPRWDLSEKRNNQYTFGDQSYEDIIPFESIPEAYPAGIQYKNDGLVVNDHMLRADEEGYALSNEIFAVEDLSDEQKKSIGWYSYWKPWHPLIMCYHKTLDGFLVCGHVRFVSIWKLSE